MNNLTIQRRTLQAGLLLAATVGIGIPAHALYAKPTEEKTAPGPRLMERKMMTPAAHQKMMEEHRKMMADLTTKDAELTELVTKLNRAPQDQKIDLVADIVTRLVAQQTILHQGMDRMHKIMGECTMLMMNSDSQAACPMNPAADEKPAAPSTKEK